MGLFTIAPWTSKCVTVIAVLGAIWVYKCSKAVASTDSVFASSGTGRDQQSPQRCEGSVNRFLMLVSTLDGQLSALDLSQEGKLVWSLQTGARGLLSSSISNMIEINKDGKKTRIIPSLDGGLYRFNGETVEAIPYSADKLLSSSIGLDDDITIVGGKEIKSYGIDAKTGRVHYVCGFDSLQCEMCSDEEISDSDDIIIVKRRTQTVRAREMRSGYEKWNFSVGQLDLTYLEGVHQGPVLSDDEDVVIETCINPEDEVIEQFLDVKEIKIAVSSGKVIRLHGDQPRIRWQHQFPSPVAGAWILQEGALEELSLFDSRHVPSLDHENIGMEGMNPPLLYIGVHQKQMYVQPSVQLSEEVRAYSRQSGVMVPKVKWRPYIATAPSRTPWLSEHCDNPDDVMKETGLSVWNYPYDNGFYLFSDNCRRNHSPVTIIDYNGSQSEYEAYTFQEVIPITLWNWWKEILAIVLITTCITLFVSSRIIKHVYRRRFEAIANSQGSTQTNSTNQSSGNTTTEAIGSNQVTMATAGKEYISRYYNDFEQQQCLGRGGFGVVFEATNRLDDCHYAIKRISLPNREESKEKVMREVKALAKLDHVNIVRYFQAWMEQPPEGWQEDKDHEWNDSEGLTPTPCNSARDNESESDNSIPKNATSFSNMAGYQSSGDFFQASNFISNKLADVKEDSFDIQFVELDSEQSGGVMEVPFQNYSQGFITNSDIDANNRKLLLEADSLQFDHTGSFNIVFENSCGADKSSNADSVFCEDHMDDLTNGSHDSVNLSISPKSFSLSSHGRKFGRKQSDSEPNLQAAGRLWKTSPGNTFVEFDDSFSLPTRNTKSEGLCAKLKKEQSGRLFLYIQMQLCRRESLKDWLNANTLNRDRNNCLDIFDQIVSAMEYVHDCGLMHRDLKPSNIFFSMDGIIKIGDFGLVTAMAEYDDSRLKFLHDKNQKHTDQVGTQLYMSPEQIAGKTYNYKVDIFAMGLIFFELVYPFSTQMERVRTLMDARRNVFPERFRRELPTECNFVQRLLASNPGDRPDVTEIQDSDLLKNYEPPKPVRKHRTRTKSSSST